MSKRYMLILHDNAGELSKLSPKELGAIVAKYGAWRDKIAKEGRLLGGEKLTDEGGKIMTAKGGKVAVRDGAYAEAKEIVGGFFIIKAKDYDDAVKVCEDCPHLALGGRIELREIDEMRG